MFIHSVYVGEWHVDRSAEIVKDPVESKQRLNPLMQNWEYEFLRTKAAISIIMAMQRQCTHTHTQGVCGSSFQVCLGTGTGVCGCQRVSWGTQDRKDRGRRRDKDEERVRERCGGKLERETAGNWVRPSVITNSGHCWTPLLPRHPPPHPRRPQQGLKQKTE